jgi:ring-1,2-phenylacetyl-CoA epoxidase subunit PaaC
VAAIAEPLRRLGLPFPFVESAGVWQPLVEPSYGGRRGMHTDHFLELYEDITSVYRLDPAARW